MKIPGQFSVEINSWYSILFNQPNDFSFFASMNVELYEGMIHSYPNELRILRDMANFQIQKKQNPTDKSKWPINPESRIIGLVSGEVKKIEKNSITFRAEEIALMAVTSELIPFSSSFEFKLTKSLVNANRAFIKPLRYDALLEDVLPDFILLDAASGSRTPMEVFGRTDEKYETRKEIKKAYYTNIFGTENWWMWDATTTATIPSLPPKVQ